MRDIATVASRCRLDLVALGVADPIVYANAAPHSISKGYAKGVPPGLTHFSVDMYGVDVDKVRIFYQQVRYAVRLEPA